MNITNDIKYVGVNDHKIDLFEGQYKVPNGMAYNSYAIFDEKITIMDTVDRNFTHEWLDNIQNTLKERNPDYLVVQHMEPDHSANIAAFMNLYPEAVIVSSQKAFTMMQNFYGKDYADRRIVINEGDTLNTGKHILHFVNAPMVHWPEVIFTYDETDKVLFTADAFGKFGANDVEESWADEARRYYIGIVGKYGVQVQNVLKKAAALEVAIICPLHGPVLSENLMYYLNLYNIWSSYTPEEEGVVIAYTSVYGNTKQAVTLLADKLREKGAPKVAVYDLARDDQALAVAEAFRYSKLVLATTTYNTEVYPAMRQYLGTLAEHGFKNRTVGIMENGSWAPMAAKNIRTALEGCKDLTFCNSVVHILSSLNDTSREQLEKLADELCADFVKKEPSEVNKKDPAALFKIGYGLYVVTTNDGKKDNGLIVNTVSQVADNPNRVAVCINKKNYSYHTVKQTGKLNVNCLSVEAPFSVFETYGFQSGRTVDKFAGVTLPRSDNGLLYLDRYTNAFMSLKVENYVDLESHGMFICSVEEAQITSKKETMTYNYYQANVKPKPNTENKKGWVCKVCGYIYEGEELPEDFVCPLCKHGAGDFEKIQ